MIKNKTSSIFHSLTSRRSKVPKRPRRFRVIALAGVWSVLLGASVVFGGMSAQAQPPADGGACPSGYASAVANKSYVGAGWRWDTGTVDALNEITGKGCMKRTSKTSVRATFTWAAVGQVEAGTAFSMTLIDCATKKAVGVKYLGYETKRSKQTTGTMTAAWTVGVSGHKYKLRVDGVGSYRRDALSAGTQGLVGYIYPFASSAAPGQPPIRKFTDTTICQ